MSRHQKCKVVGVVGFHEGRSGGKDPQPNGNQVVTYRLECGRAAQRTLKGWTETGLRETGLTAPPRLRCRCGRKARPGYAGRSIQTQVFEVSANGRKAYVQGTVRTE